MQVHTAAARQDFNVIRQIADMPLKQDTIARHRTKAVQASQNALNKTYLVLGRSGCKDCLMIGVPGWVAE